jgi:hypothetical protein
MRIGHSDAIENSVQATNLSYIKQYSNRTVIYRPVLSTEKALHYYKPVTV